MQSPHVEASTFQKDDLNDRSDLWKRLEYPSLPSGEVWMPHAVHRALRVLASAHLSSLLQIHVIPVILLQLRICLVLIHPPAFPFHLLSPSDFKNRFPTPDTAMSCMDQCRTEEEASLAFADQLTVCNFWVFPASRSVTWKGRDLLLNPL